MYMGQFPGYGFGTAMGEAALLEAIAEADDPEEKADLEKALAAIRATQAGGAPEEITITTEVQRNSNALMLLGGGLLLWIMMRK
jgi:hypothetical protein